MGARSCTEESLDYLERLGEAMVLCGFYAHVVESGQPPYLRVTHREHLSRTARVLCESDGDGVWRYVWPWRDAIGPADNPAGAAERVARVLGTVDA